MAANRFCLAAELFCETLCPSVIACSGFYIKNAVRHKIVISATLHMLVIMSKCFPIRIQQGPRKVIHSVFIFFTSITLLILVYMSKCFPIRIQPGPRKLIHILEKSRIFRYGLPEHFLSKEQKPKGGGVVIVIVNEKVISLFPLAPGPRSI